MQMLQNPSPTDDHICMLAMDAYEMLDVSTDSYTTTDNGKRTSSANTMSAIKAKKKTRLLLVQSPGFIEISSSASRKVIISELVELLKSQASKHPIKFNLKLEATCNIPNIDNSSENRSFKTSARPIFSETGVREIVEEGIMKLMAEQDEYSSKGSGYTLQCIDGLLLGVYQYTPISASSYMPLPEFIERKKAIINPQNSDQQCLKWAILAKHVTGSNKQRIANYTMHEENYNISSLAFPTKLHQVNIFEKNNPNVTVNVYGLEKHFQPPQKFPKYEVFPLNVVDEEKTDYFDLLLITDDENSHFTYVRPFCTYKLFPGFGHLFGDHARSLAMVATLSRLPPCSGQRRTRRR
ncbi:Uncharacterized protein FWK35_00034711 [Aphis craccivora]|uniref:Uncharacterized protein n=1 Tax=Aphis craccivora TaxID=307492 RepID=A0A6G0VNH1_APHCR|nr:Uncharacterized protein FWK35_00034711 [Aphis craccivora]